MNKFKPTIYTLFTLIGVFIGIYISADSTSKNAVPAFIENHGDSSPNKINKLFGLIGSYYVDTISTERLIEEAMPKILEELDPHSKYIPAAEVEATNADLASSFSGIGIKFTIQEDTVNVSDVIRGGPAEEVGLMAGDCIVKVNDTLFVGKECTNENAMKKLKGPKGTNVKISVKRYGEKELLDFNITRGEIPLESIEVAYIIDGKWGYVQVERFAENTFAEFVIALAQFLRKQCEGIIIDVRGNGGGYMGVAIQMANEFLNRGDTIVYTEGAKYRKEVERANGRGNFKNIPLVILTDETSASASEILAGAIQDNDRGTIIGRRTFGKGLVQQPFEFDDGSAMRLTVARYHTPSGRCIQKPYTKGENEEYELDILNRYERGEFFSQDSIHQNDSLSYKTSLGRTVYGGGGIMPDIFVPSDSTKYTPYLSDVSKKGLFGAFCFKYCKDNRNAMQHLKNYQEIVNHLAGSNVINEFIAHAANKGISLPAGQEAKSRRLLAEILNSHIIYNLLGMKEHVMYLNLSDETVLKAVEVLEAGEAFPQKPQE